MSDNLRISGIETGARQTLLSIETSSKQVEIGSTPTDYETYYETGYYEQRYPCANLHTLGRIRKALTVTGEPVHVLDFGCGSGRYLLPLLDWPNARFTAFDICKCALKLLRQSVRTSDAEARVDIIDTDFEKLVAHMKNRRPADIVLLLFGVLSYLHPRQERLQLLQALRGMLDQETGTLIVSVPNRMRRFPLLRLTQRNNEEGDVFYRRDFHGRRMQFRYHLYGDVELDTDLREAGFNVVSLEAESVFPESWVARWPLVAKLDQFLCQKTAPRFGYGLLAVATVNNQEFV